VLHFGFLALHDQLGDGIPPTISCNFWILFRLGSKPTDDDIVSVVEELVTSGQIPPEVGQQILQALAGGALEGGAPAAGGMPPGAEGGGLPPEVGGPGAEGMPPMEGEAEIPEETPEDSPEEKEAKQAMKLASVIPRELNPPQKA
jgi:hypothetical protein